MVIGFFCPKAVTQCEPRDGERAGDIYRQGLTGERLHNNDWRGTLRKEKKRDIISLLKRMPNERKGIIGSFSSFLFTKTPQNQFLMKPTPRGL